MTNQDICNGTAQADVNWPDGLFKIKLCGSEIYMVSIKTLGPEELWDE
jgi:hypothetical protein